MKYLIMTVFIVTGLINFYPLVGVLSAERLEALYGMRFAGPDLLILMRHRAVLFGLLGAFLIGAAFVPQWRNAAMTAGFISMVAFIVLALTTGAYNAAVRKIVIADVVACAFLLVVPCARLFAKA